VKLHHLKPAEGATKDRTRVGRGRAGTRGKTAGRGTKGWGARHNPKPGFEGGQMPLQRRVPKLKGFTNPNRVEFAVVNVGRLAEVFEGLERQFAPLAQRRSLRLQGQTRQQQAKPGQHPTPQTAPQSHH